MLSKQPHKCFLWLFAVAMLHDQQWWHQFPRQFILGIFFQLVQSCYTLAAGWAPLLGGAVSFLVNNKQFFKSI